MINNKIKEGATVRVESYDGIFEGKVKYWDSEKENLTIEPGFNVLSQKHGATSMNFYKIDIQSISVIEEADTSNNSTQDANSSSTSESLTPRFKMLKKKFSLNNASNNKHQNNEESNVKQKNLISNQKVTLADLKQYPHILIVDDSATTVLDLIIKNRLKTIGLNFYGKLIRNGYISFIGIQAENCTYILDFMSIMQQEGVEAQVIESLGYILTNGNIVKVISNCAFISDILYHKYQIVLQNVFDLQVAYATVYKDINERYPTSLVDLEILMRDNLQNIGEKKQLDTHNEWSLRPINLSMKYTILRETSRLIDLYNVFHCKLYEKFSRGCDIFLNAIKNYDNYDTISEYYKNQDRLLRELNASATQNNSINQQREFNEHSVPFKMDKNINSLNELNDASKRLNDKYKTSTDVETDIDDDTTNKTEPMTEEILSENSVSFYNENFTFKKNNNDELTTTITLQSSNNNNSTRISPFTEAIFYKTPEDLRKFNILPGGCSKPETHYRKKSTNKSLSKY